MLVLLASPHEGGVTDRLGMAAARGVANAEIIPLRDYQIAPCIGCGYCRSNGVCIYRDDAPKLFKRMREAHSLVISSPIFFYALPAPFKAFIDRSQIFFWRKLSRESATFKNAGIILAGGRPRGEKLFDGALLTLKWFLRPISYNISQRLLLRGLDNVDSLRARPEYEEQACLLGQAVNDELPA